MYMLLKTLSRMGTSKLWFKSHEMGPIFKLNMHNVLLLMNESCFKTDIFVRCAPLELGM